MMRPRLPLPDQFATMDTTLGQPVDWNRPAKIWCGVGGDVGEESELVQGISSGSQTLDQGNDGCWCNDGR